MKLRSILTALLASIVPTSMAVAAPNPTPEAAQRMAPKLVGTWAGVLNTGQFSLHLVLHLAQNSDGTWNGSLDSPDQGQLGIPLDHVDYQGGQLTATSSRLHGGFSGQFLEQEDRLDGKWSQGPMKLALVLVRGAAPVAKRPQEPSAPFPYRVEDVSYPSGDATLAGTLTLPEGHGPFPAVLLIPGSGLHDRDCTLFGHKPFKLWADSLTRRGIAVLRVDDRGGGRSTGDRSKVTSETNAQDARAGVAYLRSLPGIDPRRVGLLGHSEGGLIADMVAAADPAIAFSVLLASPGLPGDQIIEQQVGMLARASGQSAEQAEAAVAKQREVLQIVKGSDDAPTARKRLMALLSPPGGSGAARDQVEGSVDALLSPWYRFFVRTDPKPYLAKVRCPVLAVNGQSDVQVEAARNLAAIKNSLEAGGNHAVTVRSEPHLNHLFQTAKTGLPTEYAELEETIAPTVLQAVGDWILAHTQASGTAGPRGQ